MNTVPLYPASQYQPSKRRETLRTREQTQTAEQPSTILYNLRDFLPQSSAIIAQTRSKARPAILPQASFMHQGSAYDSAGHHVHMLQAKADERVIQQKMNKLKQANSQLEHTVDEQRLAISKQEEEISRLRSELNSMRTAEQTKLKRLAIWNYKYHAQYAPKQSNCEINAEYRYSLAVQTVEEGVRSSGSGNGTGLRAKDFEDIYRRLNSSAPNDGMKKKTNEQGQMSGMFSGTLTGSKSGTTYTNPSSIQPQPTKSTLKLTKFFMLNRSSHLSQPSTLLQPIQNNKQNMMAYSNFETNPMSISMQKMTKGSKPIKEQCIEIYPVEEELVDALVGEILCAEE